jgi:Xaa-Pro aminopeptidase
VTGPTSLGVAAITDREIDQRVERLQAEAAGRGLRAVICFGAHRDFWPADLRYLARWYCTDEELSFLFVTATGQTTLVTNAEWDLERALTEARAGDILYDPDPGSTLVRLVRGHAGHGDRVGLSGMEVFPAPVFVALAGGCPGVAFEGVTAMAAALRLVKSEAEIALLRAAAEATDGGMRAGLDQVRDGGSEHVVVAAAEHAIRRAGAEVAFATVMGAGPRTALATFFPSSRPMRPGDLAVLDCGARIEGYHGDMCRTVVIGGPDAVQRGMLDAVAASVRAATAAARPGARVADVNAAAHEAVRSAGFDAAWWGAFMPHGTGTGQHEMPHALADGDLVLEPGMVMCIEPGIAVPDFGAVILEQMILVGEGGAETLNALPLELWDG